MAKKDDSKIRVIAVFRMLREDRIISTREIQDELQRVYDIQADRKTIYHDMHAINRIVPVEGISGKNGGWRKVNVLKRCYDAEM